MGVHGLWELLAPVGRRVSVETLSGKKLAIDASIWMVQFMKAMRDEKGEMVRNAHLLGFFRRICKLLFLRTKPVFVFDGGTPALKRRTIAARRRHRDNAQAKIRKTAEKLLLNHLKARRLEELANSNNRKKDRSKGKEVASSCDGLEENNAERNNEDTKTNNQESLDHLLAASLAAEENGNFTGNASTSMGAIHEEEDDGEEDEEMILPVMHGKVDPAVLAALPPSMQLDLLVQMRERLMAENRQKYQKAKKTPTKFSELQIQAYLKTVAFRREIDEVQKSAAGRGVAGMQASRIASEPNREFIFSSSFTGDKRKLTSMGVEKDGDVGCQILGKECTSSAPVDSISSASQFPSLVGISVDEPGGGFDHNIETYIDERGCVRISRLRALGIRMTRDLQRNLDLMKVFEQEKEKENARTYTVATSNSSPFAVPKVLPENSSVLENCGDERNDETVSSARGMDRSLIQECENSCSHEQSIHGSKTSIEISFFEDESGPNAMDDDDLFANLVTGNSKSSIESVPSGKYFRDFSSDCVCEEGVVKEQVGNYKEDLEEKKHSLVDDNNSEGDVDWEEGVCHVPTNTSPSSSEHKKAVLRGRSEEEADIQEAIRRSLEDITKDGSFLLSSGREDVENCVVANPSNMPLGNGILRSQTSHETVDITAKLDNEGQRSTLWANGSPNKQLKSSITLGSKIDGESMEVNQEAESCLAVNDKLLNHEAHKDQSYFVEMPNSNPATLESVEFPITAHVQALDNPNQGKAISSLKECTIDSCVAVSHPSTMVESDLTDVTPVDTHQNDLQASHSDHSSEEGKYHADFPEGALTEKPAAENDGEQEPIVLPDEGDYFRDEAVLNNLVFQAEASETGLDEVMLLLQQERMDLGDEQRKLERNADSVSTEMFAECQELLQMFGLPYIIAPMEAEAQCAYMEMMNLVDGVVTDDSDVFLFGARSVYKNIFDDRKYVETYFMKDIESELGLSREKLIHMALLLGSDYTEGVSGIGIVNAIEVVNAFPEEDGLQKFREWLESPDPAILGKLDVCAEKHSRKKCSRERNHKDDSANNIFGDSASEDDVIRGCDDLQSVEKLSDIKKIFMDKHRNVSKNWHIPSTFPSESVIAAYTSPQVDKSNEPFSWGKPDLFVLRKLCWERFGWSTQKADELLVSVLNEYNKHETQLRLEAFYTFNERFAKIRSQRIKKAVKGIAGSGSSELMDTVAQDGSKTRKRRKISPSGTARNISNKQCSGISGGGAINERDAPEMTPPMQLPKRKAARPFELSGGHSERRTAVRGKKRGKGRGSGRGQRREVHSSESTESSSRGGDGNDEETEIHETEKLSGLRKSVRTRKKVEYAEKDSDIDSLGGKSNQSDGNFTVETTVDQEAFSGDGTVGAAHCPNDENQGIEHCIGKDSYQDYLLSGGGFCVDESDDGENNVPTQPFLSPAKASDVLSTEGTIGCEASRSLNTDHFSGSNYLTLENPAVGGTLFEGRKVGDGKVLPQESSKPTDLMMEAPAVELGLSAMPSLRRKKKT